MLFRDLIHYHWDVLAAAPPGGLFCEESLVKGGVGGRGGEGTAGGTGSRFTHLGGSRKLYCEVVEVLKGSR